MIVDLIDLLLIVEDGDRDVEDLPEVGDKVRVLADRTKAGSGSGDRDACRVKKRDLFNPCTFHKYDFSNIVIK